MRKVLKELVNKMSDYGRVISAVLKIGKQFTAEN